MNPLNDYPQIRKVLYLIQWITTGLTGAGAIYFTAVNEDPQWFKVLIAILAFVWTYTGITAQQNVPGGGGGNEMFGNPLERNEEGVYRYDSAGGVIILVLAIVGIVLLVLLLAGGIKL